MTEDESQLSVVPDSQEGSAAFDLGTSTLLPHARYDPVAQLLESDSDSDSDREAAAVKPAAVKALVLPTLLAQTADSAAQEKKKKARKPRQRKEKDKEKGKGKGKDKDRIKDSVVGRLAGARRRVAALESSASEDESPGKSASQPQRRLVNLRIASSDSEASDGAPENPGEETAQRQPKERAASKKALAMMHRETERLVRETLVKIDPLEYTVRLELSDFYTRFAQRTTQTPAATQPVRVRPLASDKPLVFRCTVDSDAESECEVEIVDAGARHAVRVGLEDMLRVASQPMRVAGEMRRVGRKELSDALLGAVYQREAEQLAAKEQRRLRRSRRDGEAEAGEAEEEEEEDEASEEQAAGQADGPAESIRRSQAAIASDSDDSDGGEKHGARRETPAAAKRKFLGMFRMASRPAEPAAVPAAVEAPEAAATSPTPASVSASSQPDGASQDLAHMFSSQMVAINTQDSLMMTPVQPSGQADVQADEGDEGDATQATQPFGELTQMGLALAQMSDEGEEQAVEEQVTQATQVTEQMDDAGIMPTMVRRALGQADGSDDEDNNSGVDSNHSDVDSNHSGANPNHSDAPRRRARLMHGRRDGRSKKRAASEFVAAEAEVGTSSDDSSDEAHPAGPFAWGHRGSKPRAREAISSDEESSSDGASDAEEEALLNREMIDDAEHSGEDGAQAVRRLAREQALAADEHAIHSLARDIATGALRTTARSARGFALDAQENYVDRELRAERMEERRRMRRRVEAREIHEASLARIARNPDTAAFARAALMRASDEEAEMQLDEVLDEREVAGVVRRHVEGSEDDDGDEGQDENEDADEDADERRVKREQGAQRPPVVLDVSAADADADGLFAAVPVEQLIVRRTTLLKRPGAPLLPASDATRRKT